MEQHSTAIEHMNLKRSTFNSKVVVITGAGRGIGLEAARAFAWLGASVVLAEISDEGQAAETAICREGGQALFIRTDVSDPGEVSALATLTLETFGQVDVLVNNAAYVPFTTVTDMDTDLWDRVMAVNLRGTFLVCKAFLPAMLARESGTIINMISAEAMPGLSAYIASKQGITGFTQTLAVETGPRGLRVVAFGPGMVDTPGMRSVIGSLAPQLGLSEEQFLNISMHGAYEGLMPADHAGAATAYLAAVLAEDYHGQVVNGYTVLEHSGLIQTAVVPSFSGSMGAAHEDPTGEEDNLQKAAGLAAAVKVVIEETDAEFNKLPVFARPMARSGFRSKSGWSTQDWVRSLSTLADQLQRAASGEREGLQQARGSLGRFIEFLPRLETYYQGVPAETARFSRDTEFLREVAALSARREALICDLLTWLDRALN